MLFLDDAQNDVAKSAILCTPLFVCIKIAQKVKKHEIPICHPDRAKLVEG